MPLSQTSITGCSSPSPICVSTQSLQLTDSTKFCVIFFGFLFAQICKYDHIFLLSKNPLHINNIPSLINISWKLYIILKDLPYCLFCWCTLFHWLSTYPMYCLSHTEFPHKHCWEGNTGVDRVCKAEVRRETRGQWRMGLGQVQVTWCLPVARPRTACPLWERVASTRLKGERGPHNAQASRVLLRHLASPEKVRSGFGDTVLFSRLIAVWDTVRHRGTQWASDA